MEDRKRPAVNTDDLAPPSKRQAVNGGNKSKDDSGDMREEAWIEEFQKGAIYRQMLEYKREKNSLETRLHDLEAYSSHHDDHLRIVDAWLLQLLNELELCIESTPSSTSIMPDPPSISSLAFKNSDEFERHLASKGSALKSKVESLFKRLAADRGDLQPDVAHLESQLKDLLAQQKVFQVKIQALESKNADLSSQLDQVTFKNIKAERKLDRLKSAQVHKLEQQALAIATAKPTSPIENGEGSEGNGDFEELKAKYQESRAVSQKQKEQFETVMSELKGLQDENATFKARKESITDEDYARTEVFKQFKAQNEEMIKRINNLEAINKQLREEAERMQAERTAFKDQLEIEAQRATSDLEEHVQRLETDLARIRAARDELFAELTMRKASLEQEKVAEAQIKELIETKDDRIAALESELGRLRPDEDAQMTTPRADLEAMSPDKLRQKYMQLEKDFEAINKEMPLLEKSYKKSASMAHKKVMDFKALEEKNGMLIAEKNKADQKYFASRRDMDATKGEIRALRLQNQKSSEIIAQLKTTETQGRALISNLEKQMAEFRQSNSITAAENKKLESLSSEATRRADSVKTQVSDLTNLVKSKDATCFALKEEKMAHERELEKLKARLSQVTSDRDSWKAKKLSNSSEEEDMLRKLVLCSVCRTNFKNTILKGCGHVFCNESLLKYSRKACIHQTRYSM
ncbi:hypothetical protein P8C59_008641 [Phyllachora maydis]|uniref:E3 ubiquitin protein ligase n=1 Tax=Phyllachora maydis TaxID=1825666 RepID=A0AAD9MIP9_9PEZI|nr:hypothetical protein P8C59_008641 [Phyllachora maydis]